MDDAIDMDSYRAEKRAVQAILLADEDADDVRDQHPDRFERLAGIARAELRDYDPGAVPEGPAERNHSSNRAGGSRVNDEGRREVLGLAGGAGWCWRSLASRRHRCHSH